MVQIVKRLSTCGLVCNSSHSSGHSLICSTFSSFWRSKETYPAHWLYFDFLVSLSKPKEFVNKNWWVLIGVWVLSLPFQAYILKQIQRYTEFSFLLPNIKLIINICKINKSCYLLAASVYLCICKQTNCRHTIKASVSIDLTHWKHSSSQFWETTKISKLLVMVSYCLHVPFPSSAFFLVFLHFFSPSFLPFTSFPSFIKEKLISYHSKEKSMAIL